ncbi:MAG TPA: ornithine cyclodeaminase family protein [Stellaceae bacterium]|nr:ornithine cyclodeaminase family protein [Stellaceae bacterium]
MASRREGLLILSRSEAERLMDFPAYVEAVESGLRAEAEGRAVAPPASSLGVEGGAFHVKGGAVSLGDRLYVAIKSNGNFPGNPAQRGLPTVQGTIYLADGRDGRPLAVMDSIGVTIARTGAATAVAAKYLTPADARTVLICGAGVQGRIQLVAVKHACPIARALIYDTNREAAERLAREMAAELGIAADPAPDLGVARDCNVIVTCTSSRRAFLTPDHVWPGTFIAAVGADNADKQEIDPALFPRSTVIVDNLEQCAEIGDLHHALEAGSFSRERVHASLVEIVAGRKPGRRSADEITLFDSTGLGLYDVAAAARLYERALERGIGTYASLT